MKPRGMFSVLPSCPVARLAARAVIFAALAVICWPLEIKADDASDIQSLIGATWDKPEVKVETGPVVVSGDFAIAGWTQAERGGRALLRRHERKWRVVLCGGDVLKQAAQLREAGLPMSTADDLAAKVTAAESETSPERRAAFASFNGIVEMDAGGAHHPHN